MKKLCKSCNSIDTRDTGRRKLCDTVLPPIPLSLSLALSIYLMETSPYSVLHEVVNAGNSKNIQSINQEYKNLHVWV